MDNKIKINIKKTSPLYFQVKQNILSLIKKGIIKEGERLPSEIEIARENNLSRGTVRTALAELAREGMISRCQKIGSFVTLKKSALSAVKIGVFSLLFPTNVNSFPDFFQAELVGGIREEALIKGVTLLFLPNKIPFREEIDVLLVLVPRKTDIPILYGIEKRKIPYICVSAAVDNNFNYVAADNLKGAISVMEHLFSLGHQRIGLIVNDFDYFDSKARYDGYRQALEKHKFPLNKKMVKIIEGFESNRWEDKAKKAVMELLKEKPTPTAIFAANPYLAIGAKDGIEEIGLSIPKDISLAGFDDFAFASHISPSLTTVRQDIWKIGKVATEKAIELAKRKIHSPFHIILKTRLIVRDSTGKKRERKRP